MVILNQRYHLKCWMQRITPHLEQLPLFSCYTGVHDIQKRYRNLNDNRNTPLSLKFIEFDCSPAFWLTQSSHSHSM